MKRIKRKKVNKVRKVKKVNKINKVNPSLSDSPDKSKSEMVYSLDPDQWDLVVKNEAKSKVLELAEDGKIADIDSLLKLYKAVDPLVSKIGTFLSRKNITYDSIKHFIDLVDSEVVGLSFAPLSSAPLSFDVAYSSLLRKRDLHI